MVDWEVDIFGGNRRRSEAAEAGTQAAVADKEATRLQLVAEDVSLFTKCLPPFLL